MIGKWRGILRVWFVAALIGISSQAQAGFHLWQITEVYSNASGTVQFIEFTALSGGQQFLNGITLTSISGGNTNTFTFPRNLPGDTMGKKMLLGTAGFRALNVVAPDYPEDLPDGFLFTTNGSLVFAGGADVFPAYASLPTDGVNSLVRSRPCKTPKSRASTSG